MNDITWKDVYGDAEGLACTLDVWGNVLVKPGDYGLAMDVRAAATALREQAERIAELEADTADLRQRRIGLVGEVDWLKDKCAALEAQLATARAEGEQHVGFYEREFYPLSNFSAFTLLWEGIHFDTSEAAYHWEKFPDRDDIRQAIRGAPSAHEAFKLAERCREFRRSDWDVVKVSIMRRIIRAKADQHEYVRRKLLETGDRELVEDSWRDDFWGWGPNRDGQNMLGKLWMEVRADLRAQAKQGEG